MSRTPAPTTTAIKLIKLKCGKNEEKIERKKNYIKKIKMEMRKIENKQQNVEIGKQENKLIF